jgi:hypothetical protein
MKGISITLLMFATKQMLAEGTPATQHCKQLCLSGGLS